MPKNGNPVIAIGLIKLASEQALNDVFDVAFKSPAARPNGYMRDDDVIETFLTWSVE